MTAFSHEQTHSGWRTQRREMPIRLYLAAANGEAAELVGAQIMGLPLELRIVPVTDWIDPDDVAGAYAALVQVDADAPASLKRFQKLAASTDTPLIAASYDPPLALVRLLLRTGAADVLPLPLNPTELETSIVQLREQQHQESNLSSALTPATNGRVVSIIKTGGGTGATSVLCQLAARFASKEAAAGREACLLDFDLQFGDAAFQLGVHPKLSIADLLDAGARLDGSLVRSTSARHESGLHLISSPSQVIPVEGLSSDDLLRIVDVAAREFGTAFVDLPTNWTNWSLSLLARSDLVLLVVELTVASLHRARRQLDLIRSQELGEVQLLVVANRFEKAQLRPITRADVAEALGHNLDLTIANEPAVMRAATDRGITIDQVKRRSAVNKDIEKLDVTLAVKLGLER